MRLTEPSGYHVTVLYTPVTERCASRYEPLAEIAPEATEAACERVVAMRANVRGATPLVVALRAPDIECTMQSLADRASELDLPLVAFPDGWRPHITVAVGGASQAKALPAVPAFVIATRGVVLRTRAGEWLSIRAQGDQWASTPEPDAPSR